MKNYYTQKISGSISLANDTFKDLHMTLINETTLINSLVREVSSLLAHGIAPEKINMILSKTLTSLQKLE
jgi:hypothetical protein